MKYRIFLTVAVLFALCLLLAGCGNKCTVTFDANGGTEIAAQQVKKGDRVQKPQDPEKAGYTFAGWFYQSEQWSFVGFNIAEDITLTAKWEEQLVVSDAGILTGLTEAGKNADVINIPETYNGIAITSIGNSAFIRCTGLTSITIPNSVTSIGEGAFGDCTGLMSITIPDSVTSIGSSAFADCTGLTSVTIGSGVTSTGKWAFCDCTGLTSITIPDNVTSIGSYAFFGCTGLSSITIPDSVTSIGYEAFMDCTGLTSINFEGTKAQWRAISKGSDWNKYTGNYVVHCTDGDIAK